jgi:hypothetical protein
MTRVRAPGKPFLERIALKHQALTATLPDCRPQVRDSTPPEGPFPQLGCASRESRGDFSFVLGVMLCAVRPAARTQKLRQMDKMIRRAV